MSRKSSLKTPLKRKKKLRGLSRDWEKYKLQDGNYKFEYFQGAIVREDSQTQLSASEIKIVEKQIQELQQKVINETKLYAPYCYVVHNNTIFVMSRKKFLKRKLQRLLSEMSLLEHFPKVKLVSKMVSCFRDDPCLVSPTDEKSLAIVVEGHPEKVMTLSDSEYVAEQITSDLNLRPRVDYSYKYEHGMYLAQCKDLQMKEKLRAFVSTLKTNRGVRFVGLNEDHIAVNVGKAFYNATFGTKSSSTEGKPDLKIAVISKNFPIIAVRQKTIKDVYKKIRRAIPKVKLGRSNTHYAALFQCDRQDAKKWIKNYIDQDLKGQYSTLEAADLKKYRVTYTCTTKAISDIADNFMITSYHLEVDDMKENVSNSLSTFKSSVSNRESTCKISVVIVPKDYPDTKLSFEHFATVTTEMHLANPKFNASLDTGVISVICQDGSSLNSLHNTVEKLNLKGNIPKLVVNNASV